MTLSSIAALQQAPEPNPNPHLAWVVEWGAISLPLGHPSRLTCLAIHDTEHEAAAALYECDQAGINARMWPISLNVDGQPGCTEEIASRASVRAVVKDTGEGEVRMLTDDEIADCECAREVQTGREVIRKFCEVNGLRLSTSTRSPE